jgi:hypothetical protein
MDLKGLYESSNLSPPKPFYLPRKEDPNGNKSKSYLYLEKPKYIDSNDSPLKSNNKDDDEKKNDDQLRASRLRLSFSSVGSGSAQNAAVNMLQNVKKRNAERRAKLLEKSKENETSSSSQNIVNISQNSSQLIKHNTKINLNKLNNDNEIAAIGLRNIKDDVKNDNSIKRITSPVTITSNNKFNENNISFKSTTRPNTASNCYPTRDRKVKVNNQDPSSNMSNINNTNKESSSILNARTQEDRYNVNNSDYTNISLNLSNGIVSTLRPKSAAACIRKSTKLIINNKNNDSNSDSDTPNDKELDYITRQEDWLQKKQNNLYTLKKEMDLEKASKEPIIPINSSKTHDSWEKAKKTHALEYKKQMKAEEIREKEHNLFLYPYKPKLEEENLKSKTKIRKKRKKKKRISKSSYNDTYADDKLEETALNIGFPGLGYYDDGSHTGITAIPGKQNPASLIATSKKYDKYDINDEDKLNKPITGVRIGTPYGHTQIQPDNQRDLIRDQIRDKLRDKQRDEEIYKNEIKNNKIDLKSDSLDLIFNNTSEKKIIKIEPLQERIEFKSSSNNNVIRRSVSAGNSNRFRNLFDDSTSNIGQSKPIQRVASAPSKRVVTTPSPLKKLKDIGKSPLNSLKNENEIKITSYKSSINENLNKNNLKSSKNNSNIIGNSGKNNKNNELNNFSKHNKNLSSEELVDEENRLWLASIMKQRQNKKNKEDSLEVAMTKRRKLEEERVQKQLLEFEKICIEKKKRKELEKLPLSSQYRNNIQSNDSDDLFISDTDSDNDNNDDEEEEDNKKELSSQYSSIYSPSPKSTTNTFNHIDQTSPIVQNNSTNSLNSPKRSPSKNSIIPSPKTMISSLSIIKVNSPYNTNLRLSLSKSPSKSTSKSPPKSHTRSTPRSPTKTPPKSPSKSTPRSVSKSSNSYNSPSRTTPKKNNANSPHLTDSAVKALVRSPFTKNEDLNNIISIINDDNNCHNNNNIDDVNENKISGSDLYSVTDMAFSKLHLSPFSLEINDNQRLIEEDVDNNINNHITLSSPIPTSNNVPSSSEKIKDKLTPTSSEKLKDKFLPITFFEISSTESKGRFRVNDARYIIIIILQFYILI